MKALKGKKTDVADAEWIADLFRHGLLKGSFIPDTLQRQLRDLTRYRTTLTDDRTRQVNRVQKVLEDTNIKLSSVATDIMGVSSRAILAQILDGNTDAAAMAELAKGRLRSKKDLLEKALTGRVNDHHRYMLTHLLSHIDYLDDALQSLDEQIAEQMRPYEAEIQRWDQAPGKVALEGPLTRALRRSSLPKLGPRSNSSKMPTTWHPGLGCVRAITNRPASVRVVRHVRVVSGSGGH